MVCGSLSVCEKKQDLNVCLIGDKHNIDVVDEDTIIETKKWANKNIVYNHIIPSLVTIKMITLNTEHIQRLYNA